MTVVEFNYELRNLETKLSRFALSLTSDKDDAKDLLQDTMLKAVVYREQFSEDTNLKAWIYTIMKNTFINNYRRSVRHNTVFDTTKDLFFLSQNKDTFNVSPDSLGSEHDIMRLIEGLEDKLKVPFKMHLEGYKYKEISRKLDLKIGTVKSRIFFTRKKLMDTLKDLA